jgi:hypothetical protein
MGLFTVVKCQLTDLPPAPDRTPMSTPETELMSPNHQNILSTFGVASVVRQHQQRQMECSVGTHKIC